jgi:sodium/potassium-transporting ATPase subunit alpha
VAAVEEGRVIFGNIRRFIGYVLTSNVPEIIPYIAFVLLGIPLPMPVMLILAIDLGTDLMPAIGLAAEPSEQDVMGQAPRPRNQRLLTRGLLLSAYCLWGIFETLAGFAAYLFVLLNGGWTFGQSQEDISPELYGESIAAFFSATVICQIANVMVWRSTTESVFSKGIFANRMVMLGIGMEILLVLGISYTPVGNAIFGTAPMGWSVWLVPVPFALAMLVTAELAKWRARSRRVAQGVRVA